MPISATRVFHININCRNLNRSLTFYCDGLGLSPGARTVSPEQPGDAFGLETAAWDAWILVDSRGMDGTAVDLLEWQTPPPTGAPPVAANQLGFARLGFSSTDVAATRDRLRRAGAPRLTEPHETAMEGAPLMRTFIGADPDGTAFEVVGPATSATGDASTRLSFVVVNCSDLARSEAFYSEVLGFHPRVRFAPGPRDESTLGLGPDAEWEMAYLDDPRGTGTFAIDLVQWHNPTPTGAPSSTANRVGPFRLALLTDDIDGDHAVLVEIGVRCWSPPATLRMGPGLPELRALLFEDPDGTVLELIQTPTV